MGNEIEGRLCEKIQFIIKQLQGMSKSGELNFAFAFAYPDDKGQYWFAAHTAGTVKILKSLFKDDTNAEAIVQLNLIEKSNDKYTCLSIPPHLLDITF